MTTKDMNLSLDPSLNQVDTKSSQDRTPKAQATSHIVQTSEGVRLNWQLIAFSCLAIANMAFMLLIVSWLPRQAEKSEAAITLVQNRAMEQVDRELSDIKSKLVSLQQDSQNLRLAVKQQQQLIVTTTTDIIRQTKADPAAGKTRDKTTQPDDSKPITPWYVNLGSFSTEQEATRIQQQVKALGHDAQISLITSDDASDMNNGYQLRIPGFTAQETAEAVATHLMESSDLNGLWVWKED